MLCMMIPQNTYAVLPPDFIAIPKFMGYYFCLTDEQVYSMKVGGVLKSLKVNQPYRLYSGLDSPYVKFSKDNRIHCRTVFDLKRLVLKSIQPRSVHTVPVAGNNIGIYKEDTK